MGPTLDRSPIDHTHTHTHNCGHQLMKLLFCFLVVERISVSFSFGFGWSVSFRFCLVCLFLAGFVSVLLHPSPSPVSCHFDHPALSLVFSSPSFFTPLQSVLCSLILLSPFCFDGFLTWFVCPAPAASDFCHRFVHLTVLLNRRFCCRAFGLKSL